MASFPTQSSAPVTKTKEGSAKRNILRKGTPGVIRKENSARGSSGIDDGSEAGIACLDWGEKYTKQNNSEDHMQVFLDTKGYADWLKGPAYK